MSNPDEPRNDFQRFEYDCPNCGAVLGEYAERCPDCGQNLFEVFSGTFRPKPRRFARIVAAVFLVLFVGAILAALLVSLSGGGHAQDGQSHSGAIGGNSA